MRRIICSFAVLALVAVLAVPALASANGGFGGQVVGLQSSTSPCVAVTGHSNGFVRLGVKIVTQAVENPAQSGTFVVKADMVGVRLPAGAYSAEIVRTNTGPDGTLTCVALPAGTFVVHRWCLSFGRLVSVPFNYGVEDKEESFMLRITAPSGQGFLSGIAKLPIA